MADGKRYYWLKFKEDFFQSKRIKKLRKCAGGDTYLIIYLKMQLLSLRTGGVLKYCMLEDNFAEELALDIDEKPEDVAFTLSYLANCGLIETSDNINYFMPFVAECLGSENAATQRVRDFRERRKALQCNADVTEVKRTGNVDIDIEIDIDKDIDISKDISICGEQQSCIPEISKNFIDLTLNDKTLFWVTEEMVKEYQELYPAVDVEQELRNMKGWLLNNPGRRKTKRGIKAFITNWLIREQDKGGCRSAPKKKTATQILNEIGGSDG